MALLTEAQRKAYFKALGLGEYNKTNILKVQKKYLLRKSDWDGVYGTNTDNLIRHLKAVKDNTKNFAPEEFRCGCGGRYCCGYPTWMKPAELANIQSIRTHYAKPMVVTCGVRCTGYNREVGGIAKSEHLYGSAVDYYIAGVTDTYANRQAHIGWISLLPNHHYTYGNGIFVETANGSRRSGYVSAPGMGNAMHTDSFDGTPVPAGKLVVDGIGGASTVRRMQEFFGTGVDGIISGQNKSLAKYYTSLTSVTFSGTGSACIKKLQRWVGVAQDGVLGQGTVKAWQKKLGITADGYFGTASMKAWQKYLNENDRAIFQKSTTVAEAKPTASTSAKPAKKKKAYSGKFPTATQIKIASNTGIHNKIVAWCKAMAASGKYHYVSYSDETYTHLCPICHPRNYDLGGNCIWFAWASWRHGAGLGNNCSCDVLNDADNERLREYTYENALSLARRRLGINDIKLIRNNNGERLQDLLPGDVLLYYNRSNVYKHTTVYIGNGKISDDSGANSPNIRYGKPFNYDSDRICKVAIRYTGGRTYLQNGDEGTAVARVQLFLNWAIGTNLNGKGRFGAKTEAAVKKFQKKVGLEATGRVGKKTIAAMKKYKK